MNSVTECVTLAMPELNAKPFSAGATLLGCSTCWLLGVVFPGLGTPVGGVMSAVDASGGHQALCQSHPITPAARVHRAIAMLLCQNAAAASAVSAKSAFRVGICNEGGQGEAENPYRDQLGAVKLVFHGWCSGKQQHSGGQAALVFGSGLLMKYLDD
jgi:hypothetical protein